MTGEISTFLPDSQLPVSTQATARDQAAADVVQPDELTTFIQCEEWVHKDLCSACIRVQRAHRCRDSFRDHGRPFFPDVGCTLRARIPAAELVRAAVSVLFRRQPAFTMKLPLSERNAILPPDTAHPG